MTPARVSGFTLIEILVATTLIAILTSIAIPSFTNFTKRQALLQIARQFKSDLREVQTKAISGFCPASSCPQPRQISSFCGWGIDVPANNSYQLCLYAKVGGLCTTPSCTVSRTVSLPVGTTIDPTGTNVRFDFVSGKVTNNQVFTFLSGSGTKDITIGAGGNIED